MGVEHGYHLANGDSQGWYETSAYVKRRIPLAGDFAGEVSGDDVQHSR